jgi:hypothetical protein
LPIFGVGRFAGVDKKLSGLIFYVVYICHIEAVKILKIIASKFRQGRNEKDWLQNFILLWASPKRTSKSEIKPFPFGHAERGKSSQNLALARFARLPSGEAARQSLPKMKNS